MGAFLLAVFDNKDAGQARDLRVAKDATLRAARSGPSTRAKAALARDDKGKRGIRKGRLAHIALQNTQRGAVAPSGPSLAQKRRSLGMTKNPTLTSQKARR